MGSSARRQAGSRSDYNSKLDDDSYTKRFLKRKLANAFNLKKTEHHAQSNNDTVSSIYLTDPAQMSESLSNNWKKSEYPSPKAPSEKESSLNSMGDAVR